MSLTNLTIASMLILVIFSITLTSSGVSSIPSNYSIDIKNDFKERVGHKERCRHVVRKEIHKYSSRIRMLTNLVMSLQQDVLLLRKQQEEQQLHIESLSKNITGQKEWQAKTSKDIEHLVIKNMDKISARRYWLTSSRNTTNSEFPKDCDEIYKAGGMRFPGTYEMQIQPKNTSSEFKVLCEPINNAGWLVIQSRFDGAENFRRNWHEYKKGFGKLQSEFWLGNEHIHRITSNGRATLRVEVEEFSGRKHWAEYSNFKVDNETANYTLHISGYSGNAGDAMRSINGQQFSTPDKDHDKEVFDNCANQHSAGWWYKTCYTSNINGQYLDVSSHSSFTNDHGIIWHTVHPYKTLKTTRLLVKPTPKDVD